MQEKKIRIFYIILSLVILVFAVFTFISRERIAAKCEDGWKSGAVSSGACSNHNGVGKWVYQYWWQTLNNEKSSYIYPVATNTTMVGKYPVLVNSGGGYFFDELLEYRVWIDTESGGEDLYNGDDYFYSFSTLEKANEFSKKTKGAESPLALVLQLEHIDEPDIGTYNHITEPRITEWRTDWLKNNRRKDNSIPRFLQEHQ